MPVSEITPYYVYALIYRDSGELLRSGESSAARHPRIYPSLDSAKRARKYFGEPEKVEIVEYRMTNEVKETAGKND